MTATPRLADPRKAIDDLRFRWICTLVLALALALVALHVYAYGTLSLPGLAGASSVLFFVKWAIFGGMSDSLPYSPWELAAIAWVVDLLTSIVLLTFFHQLEKLPVVGPLFTQARTKAGQTLLEYPGLRRMALSGVIMFVSLPLPGSGAVTGTLVARILGINRTSTFAAVAFGAALAVGSYALIAHYAPHVAMNAPWMLAGSLAAFAVFGWLGWRYAKRELSRS